jgi:hypothetical protein
MVRLWSDIDIGIDIGIDSNARFSSFLSSNKHSTIDKHNHDHTHGSTHNSHSHSNNLDDDDDDDDNNNHNNQRYKHNVHLVVSHCDKSIGWIWNQFANTNADVDTNADTNAQNKPQHRQRELSALYDLKSITILTKCNVTIRQEDLPTGMHYGESSSSSSTSTTPLVQVVSLPNVGRCDHSYAYWITEVLMGTKGGSNNNSADSEKGRPIKANQTKPIYELLYSNFEDNNSNSSNNNNNSNNNNDNNPFRRIANTIDPNDLVLFLKDNDNTYRGAKIDDSIGLSDVLDLLALDNARDLNNRQDRRQTTNTTTTDTIATTTTTTYSDLKASYFSKRSIRISISHGMACQSYPNCNNFKDEKMRKQHHMTNLAHRSVLWTFHLDTYVRGSRDGPHGFPSRHRPMGAWIHHLAAIEAVDPENNNVQPSRQQQQQQLTQQNAFSNEYYEQMVKGVVDREHGYYYNATHPQDGLSVVEDYRKRVKSVEIYRKHYKTKHYSEPDLVPLCFGGVFATYWGQIASNDAPLTQEGWNVVTQALSRADNLEEGHYMERWWGDLLSWSFYSNANYAKSHHPEIKIDSDSPEEIETNTNNNTTTVTTTNNNSHQVHRVVRGVTLPVEEQVALLEDKLRHFPSHNPFAGMVILDGDKLEHEREREGNQGIGIHKETR